MDIVLTPTLVGASYGAYLDATGAITGGVPGGVSVSYGVASGALPPGITLVAAEGVLTGTPTTAGTYTFDVVCINTGDSTELGSCTFSLVVSTPTSSPPSIATSSLPGGSVGATYNQMLAATGGVAPYTFQNLAGGLPPGIILNGGSGALSGTPTTAGRYTFTVTVFDSLLLSGTRTLTIGITANPVTLTTSSLPDGVVGVFYDEILSAANGVAPYSFSISAGALPDGLALDSASGTIVGRPTAAGTFDFTAEVTDSASTTATANLSITISATPLVPSPSSGTTYIPFAASGGCAPVLLVEVETASGNLYFWSEHKCIWPSILTGAPAQFLDWVVGQPKFTLFGSVQTDTASIEIQNISGNTVKRDVATAWSKSEFIGALVVCRLWRGDAQSSCLTFIGTVNAAPIDDTQMQLALEGFGNFSDVAAPSFDIDVTCPLTFGSVACGSTSPTPCDLTYGGCSSLNRFAGVVTQWDQECPNVQYAQPAPAVFYNPARPF